MTLGISEGNLECIIAGAPLGAELGSQECSIVGAPLRFWLGPSDRGVGCTLRVTLGRKLCSRDGAIEPAIVGIVELGAPGVTIGDAV